VKRTNKIDVNTPHPNFLGSLNVDTIPIIPQIIDVIGEINSSYLGKKPAARPHTNAIRSIYQNQFFIPTILNQM
jgi:hypothetical protein